jgi:hypothetical protein
VLSGSLPGRVRTGGSSSQVSKFDVSKVPAFNWQLTSKLDPNLVLRTNLWLDLDPELESALNQFYPRSGSSFSLLKNILKI